MCHNHILYYMISQIEKQKALFEKIYQNDYNSKVITARKEKKMNSFTGLFPELQEGVILVARMVRCKHSPRFGLLFDLLGIISRLLTHGQVFGSFGS